MRCVLEKPKKNPTQILLLEAHGRWHNINPYLIKKGEINKFTNIKKRLA